MVDFGEVRALFLGGAEAICEAIADLRVGDCWDQPSVLEEQTVGGLAGHLARGGVWAVAEYLEAGMPEGPVDFESAGEYFASFAVGVDEAMNRQIRERGAQIGDVGPAALALQVRGELERVEGLLDRDRLVAVIGGRVMALGEYLATRCVEQAVHLDDLARSIGDDGDAWELPDGHRRLVAAVGLEVAMRLRGDVGVVRALFRRGGAEGILPVF